MPDDLSVGFVVLEYVLQYKLLVRNFVISCNCQHPDGIFQFLPTDFGRQLNRDDVCRILARKYNELRKSRISADSGGIDRAVNQLAEAEQSISNIVKAIEQGAVSDMLIAKLKQLENEKYNLIGKIKFLGGSDQNEIYITPSVIKS